MVFLRIGVELGVGRFQSCWMTASNYLRTTSRAPVVLGGAGRAPWQAVSMAQNMTMKMMRAIMGVP